MNIQARDIPQLTHDAIKTSILRQNDVVTSFWRNNGVIIALCARWDTCNNNNHFFLLKPRGSAETLNILSKNHVASQKLTPELTP